MSDIRSPGAQRARRLLTLACVGPLLLAIIACSADSSNTVQFKMAGTHASEAAPQHNTEAYDDFIDNPFPLVSQPPRPTSPADVDPASSSTVRRFLLTERKLPPKDAVRVHELINY